MPRTLGALALLVALALPAAGAELPVPEQDPSRVRSAVEEVLSRPEFRALEPTPIERAQRWVAERLERLLTDLVGGGPGSALVGIVVVAGLLGLAATGLRFARGVRRDPAGRGRSRAAPRRTARDWTAEAEAHERAGRWAAAVRCRYRALVAVLADAGIVEEVPGRTAGEYRQEVGSAVPEASADFDGASEVFERAWYGDEPSGPDDVARVRALSNRVLQAAGP